MNITLKVWRQDKRDSNGEFILYEVDNVTKDMSFLEMLDMLNNNLIRENKDPIAFDHDCREGICGTCGVMINGRAHGPLQGVTTCQLHMRSFNDGDSKSRAIEIYAVGGPCCKYKNNKSTNNQSQSNHVSYRI